MCSHSSRPIKARKSYWAICLEGIPDVSPIGLWHFGLPFLPHLRGGFLTFAHKESLSAASTSYILQYNFHSGFPEIAGCQLLGYTLFWVLCLSHVSPSLGEGYRNQHLSSAFSLQISADQCIHVPFHFLLTRTLNCSFCRGRN